MRARIQFVISFLLLFALLPCGRAQTSCSDGSGDLDTAPPKDLSPQDVIQKFLQGENRVKEARARYSFTQDLMVQTLDDKGPDGQFHQVTSVSFDDKGKRVENVTFSEQSTLRGVQMSADDMDDVREFMQWILTSDEAAQYNLTYAGQQHVDAHLPSGFKRFGFGVNRKKSKFECNALWSVIFSPRIWLLSLVYFGVSATMYGVTLWLPSVIRSFSGLSYFRTGLVAILPFLVTVLAMVMVGARSDRVGERRWHTAIPAFVAASGLALAAYGTSTVVVVTGLSVGLACAESMVGPFWAMATSSMAGISAAAGIAIINSLANLGGYFGPDIIGLFRSHNGGFTGGLLAIAATVALSGMVALVVGREPISPRASR